MYLYYFFRKLRILILSNESVFAFDLYFTYYVDVSKDDKIYIYMYYIQFIKPIVPIGFLVEA